MANRTEREQFATAAFRMCSQIIECATDLRAQPAGDVRAEEFRRSGFPPFDAQHVRLRRMDLAARRAKLNKELKTGVDYECAKN